MQLDYLPFTIRLKRRFAIATGSRTETPAVFVRLREGMFTGYGEAALPPYRSETVDSVVSFLSQIDLPTGRDPSGLTLVAERLSRPGHAAALAAVDSALHDLAGKQQSLRWYEKWGILPGEVPRSSFTIGIGTREDVREQVLEARNFRALKVKLGGEDDRAVIRTIRSLTDAVIRVDVNQGWADREHAARMIDWLAEQRVELVEQPLPPDRPDDQEWLRVRSPLPLIADEAVNGPEDLEGVRALYDGVNVKLMKCGGMAAAKEMIGHARNLGLRVMLGCMTETTCAISAAAQLAGFADWVDLDGALLIANDPFAGVRCHEGVVRFPDETGNGVTLNIAGEEIKWISLGAMNRKN